MSFEADPRARGSTKPGMVYAVSGEHGWIYWAQVKSELEIGFFRYRSKNPSEAEVALTHEVMVELMLSIPSIGRALRSGAWKKIGVRPIGESLAEQRLKVHWSDGHEVATVHALGAEGGYQTSYDDPEIQDLDIIAAWDAEYHIPSRLTAEYEGEPEKNRFGGPMWQTRRSRGLD
ncbi:MAG: hypothetical protein AAGE86_06720 [Pseudomonadota bacterium]